jgi:hypothetical protein
MVDAAAEPGHTPGPGPRRTPPVLRLLERTGRAWRGRFRPAVDALLGLVSLAAEAGLALRARVRRTR